MQWPRNLTTLEIQLTEEGYYGLIPQDFVVEENEEKIHQFKVLLSHHCNTLKSLTIASRLPWDWSEVLKLSKFTELENLRLDIKPSLFEMTPAQACENVFSAPSLNLFTWLLCEDKDFKPEHVKWLLDTLLLAHQSKLALKKIVLDPEFCKRFQYRWWDLIPTLSKVAALLGFAIIFGETSDTSRYLSSLRNADSDADDMSTVSEL